MPAALQARSASDWRPRPERARSDDWADLGTAFGLDAALTPIASPTSVPLATPPAGLPPQATSPSGAGPWWRRRRG